MAEQVLADVTLLTITGERWQSQKVELVRIAAETLGIEAFENKEPIIFWNPSDGVDVVLDRFSVIVPSWPPVVCSLGQTLNVPPGTSVALSWSCPEGGEKNIFRHQINIGNQESPNWVDVCCANFVKSFESGTDNEGWASVMSYWLGEWSLSCAMPGILFCPWCGEKLPDVKGWPLLEVKGEES